MKRPRVYFLLSILCLVAWLGWRAHPLAADAPPRLALAPVQTHADSIATIPLDFTGNGHTVNALAFALEWDAALLTLTAADDVQFSLPRQFSAAAFVKPEQPQRLNISIYTFARIGAPDGQIAAIPFAAACSPGAVGSIQTTVRFVADPAASFGVISGGEVAGATQDAVVTIDCAPAPTATPTPSPQPSATATPTPSPTATPTDIPTVTPTATATATSSPTPTATATTTPQPNRPPLAADDAATGPEDTPLRVQPLTNDSDPDGDSLRLLAVSQPAHGSAVIQHSAVVYQPGPHFFGGDSFTYTVGDGKGHTATATVRVAITAVNDPPSAQADSATTAEDTPVTLVVLANDSDVDGDALMLLAVAQPNRGRAAPLADGRIVYSPTADFHGSDSLRYTVGDGNGGTAIGQVQVTVQPVNDPPIAADDAAVTPQDQPVSVDLLANDGDVDGDSLSASLLEPPANGTVVIGDGQALYTPAPGFVGEARFRYTLSDGAGGSASARVTIFVEAAGGAATLTAADDSAHTAEDRPALIPVLGNDSSSQGQPITLLAVSRPGHGSAVIQRDATGERILYTPAPDFHGSDSFRYIAGDGSSSASASVSVTVQPVNDPPSAQDDSATTAEEQPVAVDPLANDSDVDGDALALVSYGQAANGLVTAPADGQLRYRPVPGFRGVDSFAYEVEDGHGGLAAAQVLVTVQPVDQPPQAVDDEAALDEDSSLTFDPLGNDSDDATRVASARSAHLRLVDVGAARHGTVTRNDDDTLTYTPRPDFYGEDGFSYTIEDGGGNRAGAGVRVLVRPVVDPPQPVEDAAVTDENTPVGLSPQANDVDADGAGVQIVSFSQPSHGAVVQNADGSFTYTPASGFRGVDSFTYTLNGGPARQSAANGLVTILVAPEPGRVAAADDSAVTAEEQPLTLTPLANDRGEHLRLLGVDAPAHGSVAVNGDGSLTYTPRPDFHGSDSFGYTVGDGGSGGDRAIVTVTVQPVNDPPGAVDDSIALAEDTAHSFAPLANDADPDGDSLVLLEVTQPRFGQTALLADGQVRYTPRPDFSGADRFSYVVGDGQSRSVGLVSVTVAAQNDPPEVGLDLLATAEDTPLLFDPLANDFDADSDPLALVAVSRPLSGTATLQTDGRVRYSPAADIFGNDRFSYSVSDGSQTVTGTVRLRVAPVNDPPRAQPDAAIASTEPVTIPVLANDSDADGDSLFVEDVGQAKGSVVWSEGAITYRAAPGFTGSDVFTYSVSDGQASVIGTVSVRVATAAAALTVQADPAADTTVLPGGEVRYRLQVANVGGLPLTGVVVESRAPLSTTVMAIETEIGPARVRDGTELRWRLAELPVGQALHVGFTLRTDEKLAAPLVLTATVQSDQTPLQRAQPVVHLLDPTAVTLAYFIAERAGEGVQVRWYTGAEKGTWGFHLWRGSSPEPSQAERATVALIPARGGGSYDFLDGNAPTAEPLWYWLEEVETDGGSVRYGPVAVRRDIPYDLAAHRLFLPRLDN